MVDAEAESDELLRSRSRSLSSIAHAAKWRDKLREKAGKLKSISQPSVEQQQSNVSNFLGKASGDGTNHPMILGLQIPTNDTLDPTSFTPAPTSYTKPIRRSKGLRVSISDQEPDIIGEGGDECELPTQLVIGSWIRPQDASVMQPESVESAKIPASLSAGTSQEFLAPDRYNGNQPLQRAPTRKPVGGWEQKRSSMNIEEGLVQAAKDIEIPQTSGGSVASSGASSAESRKASDPPNFGLQRKALSRSIGEPSSPPPIMPVAAGPALPAIFKESDSPSATFIPFNQGQATSTALNKSLAANNGHLSHTHEKDETHLPSGIPKTLPEQHLAIRSGASSTLSSRIPPGRDMSHPDPAGRAESDEFYSRVQHLRGVFRLAAEKAENVESKALEQWLRMASWWFVRGKSALEKNAKLFTHDVERRNKDELAQKNHQCYVDLAKAWWSVKEVIPDVMRPDSNNSMPNKRDPPDQRHQAQLLNSYRDLQANLSSFATFMQRMNLLPPPALLIQGADPCIWLPYPRLPLGILSLTACLDPRTLTRRTGRPFFPIPFNDTDGWFCYGQIFVDAEILSNNKSEASHMPCVISMFRTNGHADLQSTILSQDGQIDLHVQSDSELGITWTQLRWQPKEHAFSVSLSRDYRLEIRMWEDDFRLFFGLSNTSLQIESQWHPGESEEILFDDTVPVFHPTDLSENSCFPSAPVKHSAIRLFRQSSVRIEGATQRRFFDGYRLTARTPFTNKHLGCLSHAFARRAPISCSNLRGENEAPALLLAFRDGQTKSSLILTFVSVEQRSYFYAAMSGALISHPETSSQDIPLTSMYIVTLSGEPQHDADTHELASNSRWISTKVISEPQGEALEHIVFSDHLRICSKSNVGNFVDLANLATGELQIGLDVLDVNTIKLYRPAQDNLIATIADNLFPREEFPVLQTTLRKIAQYPTARVYQFPNLVALHDFQKLVTGFEVTHDCLASAFSISHRRNMIPLYKKQEATSARLQLLKHDNRGQKTFQMICVLSGFPDGKIMNFQLRSTDVFEVVSKSGKHCVRFVDAKFALPKRPDNKDMPWEFVCLDVPEYPGEHDDIVIGFDTEQERDAFAKSLPAPIKVSRLQSLRR